MPVHRTHRAIPGPAVRTRHPTHQSDLRQLCVGRVGRSTRQPTRGATRRALEAFGEVTLRHKDDQPWLTDANNFILDVRAAATDDPLALDAALRAIPGVVETGLFVGRVNQVIVAGAAGVRTLTKPTS